MLSIYSAFSFQLKQVKLVWEVFHVVLFTGPNHLSWDFLDEEK